MSVVLSTVVMAHRKRVDLIPRLCAELDMPQSIVVWDEKDNRWDTGRRAMLAYNPDCTHHLVVQDDAVVPPDLLMSVCNALEWLPDDVPMCLYLGKTRKFWNKVARLGVQVPKEPSWVVMSQIHWGVGIVMPTKFIDEMIAWCDERHWVDNYDKRLSRWCEYKKISVWYPFPSLVDHQQVPSLVNGRGFRGRRAQWFVGSNRSALSQEWDRPVVRIPGEVVNGRST